MFPFYLLPYDIQDYIDDMVSALYINEQRRRHYTMLKEIECMWFWVLWGSNIYNMCTYEPIYILHHELHSNRVINYVRSSNLLSYITPSKIEFIKKDLFYIIDN